MHGAGHCFVGSGVSQRVSEFEDELFDRFVSVMLWSAFLVKLTVISVTLHAISETCLADGEKKRPRDLAE